jgi:hypothetical protein
MSALSVGWGVIKSLLWDDRGGLSHSFGINRHGRIMVGDAMVVMVRVWMERMCRTRISIVDLVGVWITRVWMRALLLTDSVYDR